MTEHSPEPAIAVPSMGLVVLVGVSGSGKSTFARTHFRPTEVVSSDFCRGLVADDENDQSATPDAFDVLHYIVGTRLRRGLLTVVDATNVQQDARASLVKLARDHDVLVDAIVLDVPESLATERNKQRPDRDFGRHVVSRQHRDLQAVTAPAEQGGLPPRPRAARCRRRSSPPWSPGAAVERPRGRPGPFDIIGDVHGCSAELRTLLTRARLAAGVRRRAPPSARSHPEGRQAVFVGDLVDRGPDTPGVLRLVMGMVEAGQRAVRVRQPRGQAGARAATAPTSPCPTAWPSRWPSSTAEPEDVRKAALDFMDGLISHYVLDEGRLVVAHAGLKESYHGRSSGRVRSFALYGDTTGETDEYGLPVRYPWAQEYRGRAMVAYGHTPVPDGRVGQQHDLPGHRRGLRRAADRAALPRARDRLGPRRAAVVRAGPPARAHARATASGPCLRAADVIGYPLAGDHPRGQGEDPRGERRGRPGDHEPVRRRPALADLPAADHVAGRRVQAGRVPGAPRAGVRGVRRVGRHPRGLRGEAHGLAGDRRDRQRTRPRPSGGSASATAPRAPSTRAPAGRSSATPPNSSTGCAPPRPRCSNRWRRTGSPWTASCCPGRPRPST